MKTRLWAIPAEAGDLGRFRYRFRVWLAASQLPEELQVETVIAVHEAMAAMIEYGSAEETIGVRASVDDDVIEVEVSGVEWPSQHADQARRLTLIQQLVEDVEILDYPSGTTVRLRQPPSSSEAERAATPSETKSLVVALTSSTRGLPANWFGERFA